MDILAQLGLGKLFCSSISFRRCCRGFCSTLWPLAYGVLQDSLLFPILLLEEWVIHVFWVGYQQYAYVSALYIHLICGWVGISVSDWWKAEWVRTYSIKSGLNRFSWWGDLMGQKTTCCLVLGRVAFPWRIMYTAWEYTWTQLWFWLDSGRNSHECYCFDWCSSCTCFVPDRHWHCFPCFSYSFAVCCKTVNMGQSMKMFWKFQLVQSVAAQVLCFLAFVPCCTTLHAPSIGSTTGSNNNVIASFQIGRSDAMWQKPVKDSRQAGGLFQACQKCML